MTAKIVGTLFIIATAAGLLSVALHGASSALMIIVMAAAVAMIPAAMFPILKGHNEAVALGYVIARTIEVVLLLPAALGALMPRETLLSSYASWGAPMSAVFFCLSVVLLNYLLFRSRLVPRIISVWALVAVAPYLADALLIMFGALSISSPLHSLLVAPLALNEMVLAIWLLTKGFRPALRSTHG